MPFPISLSKTITFDQPEKKITSDKYVLNHIHENLRSLNMSTTSASDNEFTLMKTDLVRAIRRNDFLRNLRVKVRTNQTEIRVILESNTLLIFLVGLFPIALLFFTQITFPTSAIVILTSFFWGVGYVSRWLVLREVEADIEGYLMEVLE